VEVNPLKELHFHEIEFHKFNDPSEIMSKEDIDRLSASLNVRTLTGSDVALVKVSFLPHKNGPSAAKAVYNWNESTETLLESSFEDFFNFCQSEWEEKNNRAKFITAYPSFWRMFTPKSYEKIVKYNILAYCKREYQHQDIMEIESKSGRITRCFIDWKTTFYPLIELPESITIAARPTSITITAKALPDLIN
jgi:putative alpha-1,2-mannosidase